MFGKVTKFHGSALIEAEIIASVLPETMPTTSDGIDNLGSGYTLAPGSTMIVTGTDKRYILGTDSTWEEMPDAGSEVDEIKAVIPESATVTNKLATASDVAGKVDKITGKGLSSNDYTDEEKTKLAGLSNRVTSIENVIPNTATAVNKLATASDISGENISGSASGVSPVITDAADAYIPVLNIRGRSETIGGSIVSVGDYGLTVRTTGKNLASYDVDKFHKYLVEDGTEANAGVNSRYTISYPIYLKPNTTYVISGISASSKSPSICYYNRAGNFVSGEKYNNRTSFTFTLPEGAAYCRISNPMDENMVGILQLEEGETATAYEEFRSTAVQITTALPLRSVSSSVYDELDGAAGVVITRCYYDETDDEVKPLDTPMTTALSAAELTGLRQLRSFTSITKISVNDEPAVVLKYIKNTANGITAAQIWDSIQSQIGDDLQQRIADLETAVAEIGGA